MFVLKCIECRKVIRKEDDGKKEVTVSHGLCEKCFEKVRKKRKDKV